MPDVEIHPVPTDTPQARRLGEAVTAAGRPARRPPDPAVLEVLAAAADALTKGVPDA